MLPAMQSGTRPRGTTTPSDPLADMWEKVVLYPYEREYAFLSAGGILTVLTENKEGKIGELTQRITEGYTEDVARAASLFSSTDSLERVKRNYLPEIALSFAVRQVSSSLYIAANPALVSDKLTERFGDKTNGRGAWTEQEKEEAILLLKTLTRVWMRLFVQADSVSREEWTETGLVSLLKEAKEEICRNAGSFDEVWGDDEDYPIDVHPNNW